MPKLSFDPDEGSTIEMGCLFCRETVTAKIHVAVPFRMFVASFDCKECGEELIAFDVLNGQVA